MMVYFYRTSAGRPGSHVQHRYTCADSSAAYVQFPDSVRNHCNTYSAAGVMCTKSTDIHMHGSSGRLKSYNPHAANEAFIFG